MYLFPFDKINSGWQIGGRVGGGGGLFHWTQLAWNLKTCLLGKIRKIFQYVVCWKFYPQSTKQLRVIIDILKCGLSLSRKYIWHFMQNIFKTVCKTVCMKWAGMWEKVLSDICTQQRLRSACASWSESLLSAWRNFASFAIQKTLSKDYDKAQLFKAL